MNGLTYEKHVRNIDPGQTAHRKARFRASPIYGRHPRRTDTGKSWLSAWLFCTTDKDLIEDMYSWSVQQQRNVRSREPSMEHSAKNSVARNVLRMVSELHLRGYQRLRIAPGMSLLQPIQVVKGITTLVGQMRLTTPQVSLPTCLFTSVLRGS
jgi:hypothetical protein